MSAPQRLLQCFCPKTARLRRGMETAHDPYGALRQRDYRRVLAGSVLGTIATQVQTAALDWEMYQRTQSARYLGWVGLVQFLPVLLLALPAGPAPGHYSPKGLLVVPHAPVR